MGGLAYSDGIEIPKPPPRPYGKWTLKNHFIFLKQTRTEIEEWINVGMRMSIPEDVIYLICGMIATQPVEMLE